MGWGEDEDEDEGKRRPRKDMGFFFGFLSGLDVAVFGGGDEGCVRG